MLCEMLGFGRSAGFMIATLTQCVTAERRAASYLTSYSTTRMSPVTHSQAVSGTHVLQVRSRIGS